MWGGRFQGRLDPMFAAFQKSLPQTTCSRSPDLEVNLAWSEALAQAGVFTDEELDHRCARGDR
jgi:argininosuccinate lyase